MCVGSLYQFARHSRRHYVPGVQVTKVDHHRAPVTAVQVCNASDVLVSGSRDATICLWSLDDFALLNLIQMNKPVLNLQISSDSVSNLYAARILSVRSYHSI